MERRDTQREDKVKAITFIITLPCGPARNEKWAEHTSWELVRNLPRGANIRWMWELDKE
jgi:hypothetical protein